MTDALILDTGGWLAALNGIEPYAEALEDAASLVVPGLVLAELDYFLRRRRERIHLVLRELGTDAYDYQPPTRDDLLRAREIDRKFATVELGLVDASIAALAERLGIYRLLTIDSGFAAVRVGKRHDHALELVGGPFER